MRRANDIGSEVRRSLGGPGPGAVDEVFLAALATGRRRQARNRGFAVGVLVLVGLVVVVVLGGDPRDRGVAEPPDIQPVVDRGPSLVDDPGAALLLKAARLRLEGFGDPAVAPGKLREVVTRYPGSRSAAQAAVLLRDLEGSR